MTDLESIAHEFTMWANLYEKTGSPYVVIPTEIYVKQLRNLAELTKIIEEVRQRKPKRRKNLFSRRWINEA